jgi:protein-S-isoprenylcysteine O-methyltransferase Ste14
MDAGRICSDLWGALVVVWVLGLFWRKRTQERAATGQRILYGLIVVAAFWLTFSGNVPEGWLRTRLFLRTEFTDWMGVALTAWGCAFAIWARIFIGANWSGSVQVKVGHELMRGGPYRFVRHPIYTGLSVALLGTGIVKDRLSSLVGFVLLVAGFWVKSRIEEEFMRKTFGAEYEEYARRTGGLLSRFW